MENKQKKDKKNFKSSSGTPPFHSPQNPSSISPSLVSKSSAFQSIIDEENSSFMAQRNEEYGKKEYWNERFSEEDSYEWCKDYQFFKQNILKYVAKTDKILILGCGNSKFSQDIYLDGFSEITNMDYSGIVISKMQSKFPHMKWIEMDMLDLKFENESFDVILEKGTLDVLYVEEKDYWNPTKQFSINFNKVLDGIHR